MCCLFIYEVIQIGYTPIFLNIAKTKPLFSLTPVITTDDPHIIAIPIALVLGALLYTQKNAEIKDQYKKKVICAPLELVGILSRAICTCHFWIIARCQNHLKLFYKHRKLF